MSFLFIWSTLSCLFDCMAAYLIQLILAWCYSESNEDKAIRKDLIALKKEMNSISMVDEFARYAKLQRKFNKLEDEAKSKINARCSARMKLKLMLTYSLRTVNGISTSILVFLYRNEPVVVFAKDALWPIQDFLSYPANVGACISLPVWILMMRLSISCVTAS